jgi:hypothetical protein
MYSTGRLDIFPHVTYGQEQMRGEMFVLGLDSRIDLPVMAESLSGFQEAMLQRGHWVSAFHVSRTAPYFVEGAAHPTVDTQVTRSKL